MSPSLTSHELQARYRVRLRLLVSSCDGYYDKAARFEAYAIAAVVKNLLYDTPRSPSLLTQLATKNTTRFLDSRVGGSLLMLTHTSSYSSLQPRIRMPNEAYSDKHLFNFDDWWQGQKFKIHGNTYNRKSLITVLAHKDRGGQVDTEDDTRVDTDNNAVGHSMFSSGERASPVFCAELGSVCAIGEELLFSLTPEPKNRERMLREPHKERFYLGSSESELQKKAMRRDLEKPDELLRAEISAAQKAFMHNAQVLLRKNLEIDTLSSEDCKVNEGVEFLMAHFITDNRNYC